MSPSNQVSCVYHVKLNFIVSLVLLLVHCDALPVDVKSESINHLLDSSSSSSSSPSKSLLASSLSSSPNERPTRIQRDVHGEKINPLDEGDNIPHENSHSMYPDAFSHEKHESHLSRTQATAHMAGPVASLPLPLPPPSSPICECINPNTLPNLLARAPHVLSNALKVYSQVHGRDKFDELIRETLIDSKIRDDSNEHDEEEIDEELDKHPLTSEELELDPMHSNSASFESSSEEVHSPSIALTRDDLRLIDIPVNLKSHLKSPFTSSSSSSPPSSPSSPSHVSRAVSVSRQSHPYHHPSSVMLCSLFSLF